MGLLRKKDERTETIAIRVPASVKRELEEVRQRADAAGFDLTATISEALGRLLKQARAELEQTSSEPLRASGGQPSANGKAA